MELPTTVPRERLHQRCIEMHGYRRSDGLFDIEATLVDTKSRDMVTATGRTVPAGAPVHHMLLRLVVDDTMRIHAVHAATAAAPYGICQQAPAQLQALVGMQIGAGWSRAVRERLSAAHNCTHLRELLGPLATVAYQTLADVRQKNCPLGSEAHLQSKQDSCFAYAGVHAHGQAQPPHSTPWARSAK